MEKLAFGEPFIETRYLEKEEYVTPSRCLIVNLDENECISVEGQFSLAPLTSAIVCDAKLAVPGKALVICNVGTLDLNDLQTLDVLRAVWKSNYQLTHLEKHRGVPFYKSDRITIGNVTMNFCLVSEPCTPSGIHREHGGPVKELHVQVVGEGAVDMLHSDDPSTVFCSLPLAAGAVHAPTWDAEGIYPWHRYRSVTRCIFLAVEIR